jgi:hypothetical protein
VSTLNTQQVTISVVQFVPEPDPEQWIKDKKAKEASGKIQEVIVYYTSV